MFEKHIENSPSPIRAYVTFLHQAGEARCSHNFYDKKLLQILDDYPKISRAPEPSDIIWENLEITPNQMTIGKIKYFVIHSIILWFSLIFFSFLKEQKDDIQRKYRDNMNCASITSLFGDLNINKHFQAYLKAAEFDKVDTMRGHGIGIYQCFCQTFKSSPRLDNPICTQYINDFIETKYEFRPGISLLIVISTWILQ